ncbi:MAG: phosphodiester glycosidase family protein [Clostridia bacterium]|nr:phosphodiester glycosidase family protein [Clostridia bacterium]
MKRHLVTWTLIIVLVLSQFTYAGNSAVTVKIADYPVYVNGILIDTEASQYPVLEYKNITYFPMTYDYLKGIGLTLQFSKTGLQINKVNSVGAFEQSFLGSKNILGSQKKAYIASFNIYVNGQKIENKSEPYPILVYNNITYFPMTWRFTVDEFQWQTQWSKEKGLSITVHSQTPEKIALENIPAEQEEQKESILDISQALVLNNKNFSIKGYKVDLKDESLSLKTAIASGGIGSTESLENMAKSNHALLAFNGSYFNAYVKDDGPMDPYGILIVDGQMVHNGNDRATFGIKDNKVDIDRMDVLIKGNNYNNEKALPWYGYGFNHTNVADGVSLTIYNPYRGEETKSLYGTNYIVEDHVITGIVKNQSVSIPENSYVINLNGQLGATKTQVYDYFQIGYKVDYNATLIPENSSNSVYWNAVDYAVGAGPALIINGKTNINFESEHFTEAKILNNTAQRTAIGYTEAQELIVITTQATIEELAEIMLSLGCYEAMNLDGGASSGLWYNGSYITEPGRDLSNMVYLTNK